jgi:hypothetical protein
MSCYPIAQQHLCDQFRAAIAEALRAGVRVDGTVGPQEK